MVKNLFTLQLVGKDASKRTVDIARDNFCMASSVDANNLLRKLIMYTTLRRDLDIDFGCINEGVVGIVNSLLVEKEKKFGARVKVIKHIINRGMFRVRDRYIVADALNYFAESLNVFKSEGSSFCETIRNAVSVIEDISPNYEYFVFEYSKEADKNERCLHAIIENVFDISVLDNDREYDCPICEIEARMPKSLYIEGMSPSDVETLQLMIKKGHLSGNIRVLDKSNKAIDELGKEFLVIPVPKNPDSGVTRNSVKVKLDSDKPRIDCKNTLENGVGGSCSAISVSDCVIGVPVFMPTKNIGVPVQIKNRANRGEGSNIKFINIYSDASLFDYDKGASDKTNNQQKSDEDKE